MRRFAQTARHALAGAVILAALHACSAGSPYRGVALSDLRDADGWYHLPGFRYRGEIRDGKPNGEGIALYPSGMRVQSSFTNGIATGTATITVNGVGTYQGQMRDGRLVSGELTAANGDYYRGGFTKWKPSGQGVLVRANESRYVGQFRDGAPHGAGVAFDPATNALTEGTFSNGQPQGRVLVSKAGVPSVADYQQGRDVSASVFEQRLADLALGPKDAEIAAARAAAAKEKQLLESVTEDRDRLSTMRTAEGVERFNESCFCIRKARINPDGSVTVGPDGCLEISDSNAPRPTPEQKRLWEERENARRRSCNTWANDINDPRLADRMAAIDDEYRQRIRSVNAAVEAQRRAEADRARLAAELKERQRTERIRQIAQRVQAENAAQAKKMEDERRKRCAGSNCCYCVVAGDKKALANCAPCQ